MLAAQTPRIAYPGNGSTGTFQWDWLITQASQLSVVVLQGATSSAPEALIPLTLGVDYNIQTPALQVGNAGGGYIVLTNSGWAAPYSGLLPTGYAIVIWRNVVFDQPSQFTNQGAYTPGSVESALDYLGLQIQQLQDQMNRVLQTPLGDYGAPGQNIGLAQNRALQFVCFDAAGNIITKPGVSTFTPTDYLATGGIGVGKGDLGNSLACYVNYLVTLVSSDGITYTWTATFNVYKGMLMTCIWPHTSASTTPNITTDFSYLITPNPIIDTIINKDGTALSNGQLVAGTAYLLLYDGSAWRVMV